MAIYQIDIEKSFSPQAGTTVFWTNVYHVNVADAAAASAAVDAIVPLEKAVHQTTVNFTKARYRLLNPLAQAGTIKPLSGTGARSSASGSLPLFNVFRVDFAMPSGRPNRKYLRGPLNASDAANGALATATITLLQNSYINPLVALNYVVDTQGQAIVSGAPYQFVGMRQLRRGSKKRTTPVF